MSSCREIIEYGNIEETSRDNSQESKDLGSVLVLHVLWIECKSVFWEWPSQSLELHPRQNLVTQIDERQLFCQFLCQMVRNSSYPSFLYSIPVCAYLVSVVIYF